jgi:hypothetical protein
VCVVEAAAGPVLWLKGRLHGAFLMCVSMSDKPFDAEACDLSGPASATNGLSDMKTHIENAPCNRLLIVQLCMCVSFGEKITKTRRLCVCVR